MSSYVYAVAAAWWTGDGGRTFNPRHGHKPGTRTLRLHQRALDTLGSGNLREAVKLPEGEDLNEWLACKTVDLFNEVALVHGMVAEFCTSHSCPRMNAGSNYEYKWADGVRFKTPTEVSAPQYVRLLMEWVQSQLDDPAIFPTAPNVPFPANFKDVVGNVFRRLFRVYAHIYHSHSERVVELTFEAHLNSCFKHFMLFVLEFNLVRTEELTPLKMLIDKMVKEDDERWGRAPRAGAGGVCTPCAPCAPPPPLSTAGTNVSLLPGRQSL